MGVLTDDTTRLRTQIDELRESRKAARSVRKDALADLTRQVGDMQNNMIETMNGLHDARRQAAAQQKVDLTAFTTDLTGSVAGILGEARETVAGFRDTRASTAKEQEADLAMFASTLGNTVGSMLGDFHDTRLEMAQETRDERLAAIGALRDEVNALRRHIADDLAGARQSWGGTRPAARVAAQKRA